MQQNRLLKMFIVITCAVCCLYVQAPAKTYEYVEQVGGEGYEHHTIQNAIDAMNEHELGPSALGCIEVAGPGTYTHNSGAGTGLSVPPYPDEWIPKYCDVVGIGNQRPKICHDLPDPGPNDVWSNYVLVGAGENEFDYIEVESTHSSGNGIKLREDGTLSDCIIWTKHNSVSATETLTIVDCTITGNNCVEAGGEFDISNTDIEIRLWGNNMEWPEAITGRAHDGGTIENVTINIDDDGEDWGSASAYARVVGIRMVDASPGCSVDISDVDVTVGLKSEYSSTETSTLGVCGISCEDSSVYVDSCTIHVTGKELTGAAGVTVDGVYVTDSGSIDITDTSIATEWTPNGTDEGGYEHLLYAKDGTITVDRTTCDFDPNGSDPSDRIGVDPNYVVEGQNGDVVYEWDTELLIQDSSGESVAWFDQNGNLALQGEWSSVGSIASAPANSFILKNSSNTIVGYIDSNGNLVTVGNLSEDSGSCSPGSDAFIIAQPYSGNYAYIDLSGDICLTGLLFENEEPFD